HPDAVAVMVALPAAVSPYVKVAELVPAPIVRIDGKEAVFELEVRLTEMPSAGAGVESWTVPVVLPPIVKEVGLKLRPNVLAGGGGGPEGVNALPAGGVPRPVGPSKPGPA